MKKTRNTKLINSIFKFLFFLYAKRDSTNNENEITIMHATINNSIMSIFSSPLNQKKEMCKYIITIVFLIPDTDYCYPSY
jgi:hypothetical protein